MARITGSIPHSDIANLNGRALDEALTKKHRELVDQYGFGLMHTTREQGGDLSFTFDYAEGFQNIPQGSHLTKQDADNRFLLPEQVEAIHHANVVLKNSAGIKQVPDGEHPTGSRYEPLTDDKDHKDYDPAASAVCRDINVLEALLEPYDTQGKVKKSTDSAPAQQEAE